MLLLFSGSKYMSAPAEVNVVNVALGFLVFMFVLMYMQGLSAAAAIFAIPTLLFSGFLMIISQLLGVLLSFFVGAIGGGLVGLAVFGIALVWLSRSVAGIAAQSYMLFAIFIIMMLLVV
ncbi:MAG: hypothetical protein V1722_02645 [Candidatus Micrarchaeota archaeon]